MRSDMITEYSYEYELMYPSHYESVYFLNNS